MGGLLIAFPFSLFKKQSWMKVKDIYSWTNITDSGCDSKVARFNDILSSFAMEVYDFYPRKVLERFTPTEWQFTFSTKYPIAKVWGFFGKGCCLGCSLDPKDCCAGYKRLLMEELYWDDLDANSYSIKYSDATPDSGDEIIDNVTVRLPKWATDALIVYSKGFPYVTSLDQDIDIDRYTLSLLRLYMKSEYALEDTMDINMSANYYSRFEKKLKKLKEMFDNNIKYIVPWALNAANQ